MAASEGCARRGLSVRGVVQGVGFRPFVHRLATELALSGVVGNDERGVFIEVEGPRAALDAFAERLVEEAPVLSRVASIDSVALEPTGIPGFRIVESARASVGRALVPPDTAPCADCLRELGSEHDRRYRYPFLNCTVCGPRYTLVRDVPYDRARTTMHEFVLCTRCRGEYLDPADRRFHAEPNACPLCGPSLRLIDPSGAPTLLADAALLEAARAIARGLVVAVKGVGGFALATSATDEDAVARLRVRKRRPDKPFAVMARDLEEARRVAHVSEAAERALLSPARPIVLLPAREDAGVAPSIAPRLREIGVMLPPSPLHELLARDGPALQVMTSGNVAEEPIAKDDDDALGRLSTIADLFLVHDRAIHTRVDDSVLRVVAGDVQPVRRARGYVPLAVALAGRTERGADRPVLAVGADLKSTICIARDGEALLSQHIGDLAGPTAFAFFEETIAKLSHLLGVVPEIVAHDLHPEYRSTRWALASQKPRIPVQHHHAHVAACLAENGATGPALGVAFDGTGCGPEGDLWGGELLIADLRAYRRAGHLRPVALPGGEAAIRAPWRLGLAALVDAGAPHTPLAHVDRAKRNAVEQLIERRFATPYATGAGRWFDAVAAIVGITTDVTYEGQAAIELEALAAEGPCAPYPFELDGDRPFVVDLRPTVRAVAADVIARVPVPIVSARFHETMAHVLVEGCRRMRAESGLSLVALSGGCFQNVRLTERALDLLQRDRFEVLLHRLVPPNDGGLALGQAAVASCVSRKG